MTSPIGVADAALRASLKSQYHAGLAMRMVSGIAPGFALTYLVLAMRSVYGGSLRRNLLLGGVIGVTYWLLAIAVTIAILLPVVLRPGR